VSRCRFYPNNLGGVVPGVGQCDETEDILPNGYCILHEESFLKNESDNEKTRKEKEEKVRKNVFDKLSQCISTNKPFNCICYYLPELDLRMRTFVVPVNFIYTFFLGYVNFSEDGGSIILTASIASSKGFGGGSVYSATKAAIR